MKAETLMKGRLVDEDSPDDQMVRTASSDDRHDSNRRWEGEEHDEKDIDFLSDPKSEMTFGRRIALLLMNQKWYYPGAQEKVQKAEDIPDATHGKYRYAHVSSTVVTREKPSLEKAWAYFEHFALPRYLVKEDDKKSCCAERKLNRAEPGESYIPTKLYSAPLTPHSQLGDFGLGIGLYFSTLRAICFITFIAGMMNIPSIKFFASDEYLSEESRSEIPALLQGSAICTDTSWVPCPDCNCTDETQWESNRCAYGFNGFENLTYALHNNCPVTNRQLGLINFGTMILVFLCTMGLGLYLYRQEVQFDEDEQTAQDYSIVITNPPPDANDPEEWRRFFRKNCDGAKVTVCTCAVDNDLLVRTLLERRELVRKLENLLEPGTHLDTVSLAKVAANVERERKGLAVLMAMLGDGIPELFARIVALNAKVQGLAQLEYPVTNVFITFETEKDQRNVLSNLSVGSLKAARNDKKALKDSKYLFRGETVLAVSEPAEPNTIRWQDLNGKAWDRTKQQCLTLFATLVAIVIVAVMVWVADRSSTIGAALAISIFNSIFPMFAKMLTDLESHAEEGHKQTSLYSKIALFRWVNTAIVITIVTPFTNTLVLENGLIPQIYAIFFSEIITVNLIQLADPMGHIKRHYLAPRANTQDAMNLNFQGEQFELAERYTNMTKILFLALWYCAIYPAAFFMCSFALFINYYADRFSLMRTWKRPPHLGTTLSRFSRRYFFSLAIIAMVTMSSFYWSAFPFDNLCESETIDARYSNASLWVFPLGGSEPEEAPVSDVQYRYCLQDLLTPGRGNTFPFIPSQQPPEDAWMTPEQEDVTLVYGWTSVAITFLVVASFCYGWLQSGWSLISSSYEACGEDQGIAFSDVPSISAYIPQVSSLAFAYPLFAAPIDDLDPELFDWTDPDRPFSYYDLSKDASALLGDVDASFGFSQVKHWPPKKKRKASIKRTGSEDEKDTSTQSA